MKVKVEYNISDQAGGLLMKAGDHLWRECDRFLSKWDLTVGHYNVLRIINGAGEPLSQVDVSRQLISSRANVTKLVDKLESLKLAERITGKDRRIKLIKITEKGFRFMEEVIPQDMKNTEHIMGNLTKKEQETLITILKKL